MSMYDFSLCKCHNSYVCTSFRISFSYLDRVQNLYCASMTCGNLPSWKSGIASHGGLTANANWRKDGNKETSVSLSSLVVQILPLKNQRLFFFEALCLYTKEETYSFCFVNSDPSVLLLWFLYLLRSQSNSLDEMACLIVWCAWKVNNILWFCNTYVRINMLRIFFFRFSALVSSV